MSWISLKLPDDADSRRGLPWPGPGCVGVAPRAERLDGSGSMFGLGGLLLETAEPNEPLTGEGEGEGEGENNDEDVYIL
ncbi:hypothetical protein Trco_003485 [Trichoderma cornu-damae]|uniref:Uncharacterized protein n=1 Tax=Trichoderma cornu-damae TaxID=654480 RepID=A0A9P8QR99_9HYPO|nr:hypothetical protein Trco_003485 [Trichoderma cornu-damae]